MAKIKPAKKAAKKMASDGGESVGLMEPMLISHSAVHRSPLIDKALELNAASVGFCRSLPPAVARSLSDLVRSMNCYYSNLIEGHDTHPIDIERALKDDYSTNIKNRNLQLEAKAHIEVQKWIDEGNLEDRFYTTEGILEVHRRFCELLPSELLFVENPQSKETERVLPGQFRARDVKVGRHLPISAGAVPRFLRRFEETYANLGVMELILCTAAAHHRLVWIHPFLDGNGRVARLISYASLLKALGTGGLWSIARGLARSVSEYRAHLMACDSKRRGDLDGRGNLSEEALTEFTRFFLDLCLDQVHFMESLLEPRRFRDRVLYWVHSEIRLKRLHPKSSMFMEAALYRGEILRGEVAGLIDASERTARRVASDLLQCGVLESASSRAPLRWVFPAKLASHWFPGLFPEKQKY